MVVVVCECHLSVYKTVYHCQNYTRYSKCTTFSVLHRYRHRHLHQAWAYPGYFEACILLSQGPNAKTRGMPSDQHKCAYTHRCTYSVQCSDKIRSAIVHQTRLSQVLPGYPHSSAGAYGYRQRFVLSYLVND